MNINLKQLNGFHEVEVDGVSREEWDEIVSRFEDGNIYQSWAYGANSWGRRNLGHVVVRRNGIPVAAAQLRLWKCPGIPFGIAYLPWGPLWKKSGETPDREALRLILNAIATDFGKRRKLCVRIAPKEFDGDGDSCEPDFSEAGFLPVPDPPAYHTFRVDLYPAVDRIRKSLNQKWRNQLNRSEKNGLSIETGVSANEYRAFLGLMQQTLDRKAFRQHVSYEKFGEIQESLPESLKMRIWICSHNGEPACAALVSRIGERGIYMFGATAETGLKLKGSYLLQWEIIKWLKETGASFYDLGGIDPVGNPGVFHFKEGLGGTEANHAGSRQYCPDAKSRIFMSLASSLRKHARRG